VNEKVKLRSDDLLLGQLPSNHVFMWNGIGPSIWAGIPAFYCHPLEMKFHVKQLHPTILFGVPKVWVAIYNEVKKPPNFHLPFVPSFLIKAVNSSLAKIKAELLRRALAPHAGRLNQFCNFVLSSKLQSALGGRLRIRVSGGAALPREVSEFFRICHQEIMNGYGATETTGCICVETAEEKRAGSAGRLLSLVGVDFEASDQFGGFGVMQIGGPTVSPGYWNKPEQTVAAFIQGKFRSGDLGKLDDRGYLFIGAREDDDGKLANGEKVSSLEIIEAFRECDMIEYIVPIFAGRPVVAALIFLREAAARSLLETHARGVAAGCSLQFMARHPVIIDAVCTEIGGINERLRKKGEWKRVRYFEIVPETPSTVNGFLTVKMEVSARKVSTAYADLVEEMFRNSPRPGA
jgi:long-chain acyl-CoA synthetase